MNVVKGCINGQQITQEDKKMIEEEIIILKQDIDYEENCLNEYSNIVYSEDLNIVNVRLKVSYKLFYNTQTKVFDLNRKKRYNNSLTS